MTVGKCEPPTTRLKWSVNDTNIVVYIYIFQGLLAWRVETMALKINPGLALFNARFQIMRGRTYVPPLLSPTNLIANFSPSSRLSQLILQWRQKILASIQKQKSRWRWRQWLQNLVVLLKFHSRMSALPLSLGSSVESQKRSSYLASETEPLIWALPRTIRSSVYRYSILVNF